MSLDQKSGTDAVGEREIAKIEDDVRIATALRGLEAAPEHRCGRQVQLPMHPQDNSLCLFLDSDREMIASRQMLAADESRGAHVEQCSRGGGRPGSRIGRTVARGPRRPPRGGEA